MNVSAKSFEHFEVKISGNYDNKHKLGNNEIGNE
jgi:hypothetical protein